MQPPQATSTVEDIQMTREESERLENCFKDKKFRDLLEDYVKEISNPTTKHAYEEYLKQVEREGGAPANRQLMKPEPVFCIRARTRSSSKPKQHIFINCCEGKLVKDAKLATSSGYDHPLHCSGSKRAGLCWQIPYVLGLKRFDGAVPVYDVAFSAKTVQLIGAQPSFKKAAIQTAIEAVDGRCDERLSATKFKVLKGVKCKGNVDPPIMSIIVENADERMVDPTTDLEESTEEKTTPKLKEMAYRIVESDNADILSIDESTRKRPRRIFVAVELKEVSESSDIDAQINGTDISITVKNGKYQPLEVSLAKFDVVASSMRAQWFADKKELRLTFNVAPPPKQSAERTEQRREIEAEATIETRERTEKDSNSFLMKEISTKCVVREHCEDEKETNGEENDEKVADEIPRCRCDVLMSEQSTSNGRAFFVCSQAQSAKCTAFRWKNGADTATKRLTERFEVEQRRKIDKTALLVRVTNIIASTVDVHFEADGRVLIQFETHELRYRKRVEIANYRIDVAQSRFDVNSRNLLVLVVKERKAKEEMEDLGECIDDILMDSALEHIE